MRFVESSEGDYQILARAIPGPRGRGYVAAVTVRRVRGISGAPRNAFHDDSLAGGHAWPSAQAARLYAVARAHEVIRVETFRLSC